MVIQRMFGTRRIFFTKLNSGRSNGTMGSDLIQTVLLSPEYARWKEDKLTFRFTRVLSYQVGAMFAFGAGSGPMWVECLFDFEISDEQKAVLMLRDNVRFNTDLEQYDKAFDTGCGWERFLLRTDIQFGKPMLCVCDLKCEKAWGHDGRSGSDAAVEYDDEDDVVDLADSEVTEAPRDPGTYEGGEGKPFHPERHNKWCVRQCERSNLIRVGEEIKLFDHAYRVYNQPWKHPEAAKHNRYITTGKTYEGPDVA